MKTEPMKPIPYATGVAAALALSVFLCAAPAWAGTPDEHFVLSPTLVQKVKAATRDLEKLDLPDSDDKEDDKHRKNGLLDVEYFAKSIESKPGVKPTLAKHGLSSREYALASYAVTHGALYLAMEPTAGKKGAADMMAKFTKEQQANIALLRKLGPAAYSSH